VLGTGQGPRSNAGGTIALPNTGDGHDSSAGDYTLAVLVLAMTGAGMLGAVIYRRRRAG
jgi:hypothetical protein